MWRWIEVAELKAEKLKAEGAPGVSASAGELAVPFWMGGIFTSTCQWLCRIFRGAPVLS